MTVFFLKLSILYVGLWLSEPAISTNLEIDNPKKQFTIVLMTDTHIDMKCKESDLKLVSQWIAKNDAFLNIAYVAHQGDVGDHRGAGSIEKMLIKSRNALQPIINRNIPLSVAIGNHDYDGNFSQRSSKAFNRKNTFGKLFYQNMPGFGGTFSQSENFSNTNIEGTENHFYTLDVLGEKFLFLTLEYYPRDAVLVWANDLVQKQFPNHQIVVITHAYIDRFGKLSNDRLDQNKTGFFDSHNGEDMWNRYFKNWKNLRLIFSGHFIDYPRQSYLQQIGIHGNVVNSHFFNYQNWGFDNEEFVNKRKGLRYQASVIRLVTINMDENYVRLQNFLPQKNLEIH
jgi:hypothetical protein